MRYEQGWRKDECWRRGDSQSLEKLEGNIWNLRKRMEREEGEGKLFSFSFQCRSSIETKLSWVRAAVQTKKSRILQSSLRNPDGPFTCGQPPETPRSKWSSSAYLEFPRNEGIEQPPLSTCYGPLAQLRYHSLEKHLGQKRHCANTTI